MVARHALVAHHARARVPAQADRLPHGELRDILAQRVDRADNLMAGHHGVPAHLPLVIEHRQVGMA